ncbi:hypothetical protein [Sphingomonas solaris]|uniref:Uncharacterized protein n=1 Tax=Alterirhizorhabdus solaris TaxID=2529389 RepID=A0A558RBB4_9SPHN|nr:hypothetical protein [Sphingomonas solaris]TVV76737.1 hypothetical protein FOY91_03265 [Sphingomonas solaris]
MSDRAHQRALSASPVIRIRHQPARSGTDQQKARVVPPSGSSTAGHWRTDSSVIPRARAAGA